MGFLNNTTVTVDAILTKKGRELLAQGTEAFNITKFALADDEVDYNLWDVTHPNGTDFYGKVIENMPLLEAIPDENHVMRYKLITLPKNTIKMPVLTLSQASITFTASAGTPATINTFAYHDNDKVVEYTVYIKNGSDFQSQKLLAMRDGTTIHSTQFAVMFSSSLLVQCDATISSGNILLRATPETGVSGSTTYKIKREVM